MHPEGDIMNILTSGEGIMIYGGGCKDFVEEKKIVIFTKVRV